MTVNSYLVLTTFDLAGEIRDNLLARELREELANKEKVEEVLSVFPRSLERTLQSYRAQQLRGRKRIRKHLRRWEQDNLEY